MPESIDPLLPEFQINGRAAEADLTAVEAYAGCALPDDYKSFMLANNGGEGSVGEAYLVLWRLEEIIEFNRDYDVAESAPGLFLFGSDGGGELYGFDLRDARMVIVMVPGIGLSREDALPVASDFNGFIVHLASPDAASGE